MMKRSALVLGVLLTWPLHAAEEPPKRPHIYGIASVRILVTDISAAQEFYSKLISKDHPCLWCGQKQRNTFSVNPVQFVELATWAGPTSNRIDEIIFATDDIAALKQTLTAHNVSTISPLPGVDDNPILQEKVSAMKRPPTDSKGPELFLTARDPDGHRIGFVQLSPDVLAEFSQHQSMRLIHVGAIVRDRTLEDSFYKDILDFHLYWHGGRKDGETDWVNMQVPDGTDWIEYMLNVSPDADKHTLGVMNHIAIGVPDIEAANFAARKNGVVVPEQPKIGRGGKWQLSLYDPDDTRVEFMEFTPVQKPCCSEYTGPHPGPKQ